MSSFYWSQMWVGTQNEEWVPKNNPFLYDSERIDLHKQEFYLAF